MGRGLIREGRGAQSGTRDPELAPSPRIQPGLGPVWVEIVQSHLGPPAVWTLVSLSINSSTDEESFLARLTPAGQNNLGKKILYICAA